MKIHFNKYEYFLILMVNILLLLSIMFATQNCKENNQIGTSGFHKTVVKYTLKEKQNQDYWLQNIKENERKKTDKLTSKNPASEKDSHIDNLYRNFSIYSFFNY